jgi:hypothetical protein
VLVMAVSLAGCCCCLPISECDICGDKGFHEKHKSKLSGEEYPVCDDCYEDYRFLFR